MKAYINKIIDFSTVDGPGLRTSIFFQKCNISCLYCHNPETQHLCNNCAKCVDKCPQKALSLKDGIVLWDKEKCVSCDTCISVCQNHASPKVLYLNTYEVFDSIKKNIPFIRGITVSGGECSLNPLFLEELFKLAKEANLTCLMDSNGMVDYSKYPNLMDLCDGVMLDIKSWDNDIYKKLTGSSNDIVKKNLEYLNKINKIEELRIVYLKDYVDAKSCLIGIKDILKENIKTVKIKLIKFRQNGVKGILKDHPNTRDEEINEIYDFAKSIGFVNVVIR